VSPSEVYQVTFSTTEAPEARVDGPPLAR
jgi:hypothetical protein